MAKKVKPGKLRGQTNLNNLTTDENDYTLSIIGGMTYSLDDLAQLVVQGGNTTQRKEQLLESFLLVAEKGVEMGLQGNNINFDLFTLRFGVKGVFNSANEPFTRPKHEVTASMAVGPDVRKAMQETMVENMGPAQHYAQMDTIINTVNGEVNRSVTSGQVLEVKGVNLPLKGADPSVGIYIQEVGAADETRIKATVILNNEPKRLMFMVPAGLKIGSMYQLVHITQASAGTSSTQLLKSPRIEFGSKQLKCTDGTPLPEEGEEERPGEL
ncbi:DNA-binding domain-containing protein [uncultured Parabacteroides sp.]|uniref:DNA-binding domain-containing protein n=1 Tax=uncultured Parabacteroides sp. TaxID=512312 RepID=UPI00260026D5|nr:DNA-binding domain-containing protein [uncultured Parabacteroides sp.]